MKNLRLTVLAALLAVSASQVAFAQPPGMPPGAASQNYMRPPGMAGAPGMGGTAGAPGAAANVPTSDSGDVSNAGGSTTTFSTTTSTSGISPDAGVDIDSSINASSASGDETLTNTGGEPILMTLVGLAVAASAFAFRRKVSA